METRGRGREARASTDDTQPSTTPATTPAVHSNPRSHHPPSTRSRTRHRAAPAHRNSSRSTRASAANSSGRANTSPQLATQARSVALPITRSRRNPAARRAALSPATSSTATRPNSGQRQSSFNVAPVASTNAVTATRKRTRSSSRRNLGQPTGHPTSSVQVPPASRSATAPSSAAAASAAIAAALGRPSKRARRALHSSRQSRAAASSRRGNREMDLSSSQGGGNERNPDQNPSRSNDDGPSSLGSDRAGANTLQGLLRRLGADLSEIFPGNAGSSHSRLQQLRTAIATPESDEQQIDALSELCEFLSVGTEESLVSFSVNLFVAPLVNLLRNGNNIEIKIYAARALTHMMEALPSSSSTIANHGAAGPLCQNLLSIEYIDLAEQSLSALQKLSVDYPQQIVSANGFQAVLSFIDFFSIGVQRVAAATACNLCRLPRADAMDMISSVLPTMMRLLDSDDQRIRESAVLGFTRLAESFRNASSKLEALCGEQATLIDKVLGLIVPSSPPALAPQSYASALRLLSMLARGSAPLGLQILSTKSLILKLQSRLGSGATLHSVDCLVLADSLLPDIPEAEGSQTQAIRSRRRRSVGSTAAYAAVDTKRREDLEKDMAPLQFFGRTLFGTLMKFYISSADSNARRLALSIMSKFIAIAPHDVLLEVIMEKGESRDVRQKSNSIRFCPFVAALLGENSSRSETLVGLAMADSALQKLPSLRESFVREGVVHEIVRLAAFDESTPGPGGPPGENTEANAHPAVEPPGDASSNGRGNTDAPGENPLRSSSDELRGPATSGGMDSIWTAVAAIQRGSYRPPRADFVPVPPRLARALDIRFPELQTLQALVAKAARSILRTHLGAQADGTLEESVLKNTILGSLTDICRLLRSVQTPRHEPKGVEAMSKLIYLLTTAERLTIFEISKSGLMEAMASYLSPSDVSLKSARVVSLVECLNKDNGRGAFSSLVDLTLGVLSSEEKLAVQANESAAGTVSSSVNSGLRQLAQPFKLRLRKASADAGGAGLRDYSHHVVLIEPLATMASVQEFLWPKVRESERAGAAGASGNQRRRSSQGRGSRGRATDAPDDWDGPAAAAPGDSIEDQLGEELDEDPYAEEAMFALEIENNDEQIAGNDDEEQNSDPSDEEVSSGEEDVIEQEAGESDDHEADAADAFDVDQLATSLPPFELDHDSLGQAPGRARRPQSGAPRDSSGRGGSASRQGNDAATTFRSYAAALAANMPRGLDRISSPGVSGNRRTAAGSGRETIPKMPSSPKLAFTMNGKAVPHDCSILSAVIRSSAEDRDIGPRLWADVHTLVYSKSQAQSEVACPTPGLVQIQSTSEKIGSSANGEAGPVRRSQRLQEHREKSQVCAVEKKGEQDLQASDSLLSKVVITRASIPVPQSLPLSGLPSSISPIIEVLKQLYWIHEKMSDRSLRKDNVPSMIQGLREDRAVDFHSRKLSAKLIRQLSDPLALCGGVVPSWCFSLSRDASFLIPFETRRILFQSTALGVARALHLLQTRVEISGVAATSHRSSRGSRDNEARIGRIQRQKVRLHRNRILESAIKVMSLYGAHTTVLEVEYFDEAGTGLGPTLEFYTLASREIQRVDLGLWRGTAAKLPKQKINSSETNAVPSGRRKSDSTARPGAVVKRRSRRHSQSAVNTKAPENIPEEDESPAFVIPTGSGLFPSCLPVVANDSQKESSSKTTALFGFVGRLLGKAMIDGRLLDLRFSKTFSRLLLAFCRVFYQKWKEEDGNDRTTSSSTTSRDSTGRSRPVLIELDASGGEQVWDTFTAGTSAMKLLEDVDPQLASSLHSIMDMVRGGQGESVEGLCLTFVLPGDDDVELIKNGSNVTVTGENAEEFVRRVVFHVLFGGVQQQTKALLQGLSEVLDITSLLAFKSQELELLICGPSFEEWTVDFLVQATRCDHGYSHESPSVLYFLRILSELDQSDQQRFVLFATGSPALPLGGLRNLHPKLTIVRRTPEAGRSADECLPTVMTCTNYFKLPDYSSFEIARKQIMYAVREGQGSFHLS